MSAQSFTLHLAPGETYAIIRTTQNSLRIAVGGDKKPSVMTLCLAPEESYTIDSANPSTVTITFGRSGQTFGRDGQTFRIARMVDGEECAAARRRIYGELGLNENGGNGLNSFANALLPGELPYCRIQKKSDDFSAVVTTFGRIAFCERGPDARLYCVATMEKTEDHDLAAIDPCTLTALVARILLPGDSWSLDYEKQFHRQIAAL